MNPRDVTQEQIRLNARMRVSRRAAKAREKRRRSRQDALVKSQGLVALMVARELGPHESAALAYGSGHQAAAARRISRLRGGYYSTIFETDTDDRGEGISAVMNSEEVMQANESFATTKAPSTLQKRRRSQVVPWLVPMVALRLDFESSCEPYIPWDPSELTPLHHCYILDACHQDKYLTKLHEEGMQRRGYLPRELDPDQVAAVRAARAFWNLWERGFIIYESGVQSGDLWTHGPGWSCLDKRTLPLLLPGIHIPKDMRRDVYLLRLHRCNPEQKLVLDAYGEKLKPLFRHPMR